MRPHNLFRQIITRLSSSPVSKWLSPTLLEEITLETKHTDLDISFLKLSHLPLPLGWNKLWVGGRIYGWYGNQVTFYPLRILAIEWRELVDHSDEIRHLLNRYYEGGCALEEIPPQARSFLSLLAIPLEPFRVKVLKTFLRRINADTREMPIIERWRWARDWGWAHLSDGDTIQISLIAAWTRILDPLLFSPHPISDQLKTSLEKVISGYTTEDLVIRYGIHSEDKCLQTLEFYGIGERWREGYHLIHHLTPKVLKLVNLVIRAKS